PQLDVAAHRVAGDREHALEDRAEVELLGDDEADLALGGEDVDARLQLRLLAAKLRFPVARGADEVADLGRTAQDEGRDGGDQDAGAGGNNRQRPALAKIELYPDRRRNEREHAEEFKPLPHLSTISARRGQFPQLFSAGDRSRPRPPARRPRSP